jgi:hypothetical protein
MYGLLMNHKWTHCLTVNIDCVRVVDMIVRVSILYAMIFKWRVAVKIL